MHLPTTLSLFLVSSAASFSFPPPQHVFSNPPFSSDFKIPTIHESAIQARRILNLETIGTLSTVFPHSSSVEPAETRPSGLEGAPIGLMDYYADCEPQTGNPTVLAISIATSFKNVAAGSNITLSLRWHPPDAHLRRYSAANLPRFSLVGHLEELTQLEIEKEGINGCFVKKHPDARAWLPGNRIHESRWVRLVVEDVYWIGGFGDRAYIGWIPVEDWRSVTKQEVEGIRLPGEQRESSWKDWIVGSGWDL